MGPRSAISRRGHGGSTLSASSRTLAKERILYDDKFARNCFVKRSQSVLTQGKFTLCLAIVCGNGSQ